MAPPARGRRGAAGRRSRGREAGPEAGERGRERGIGGGTGPAVRRVPGEPGLGRQRGHGVRGGLAPAAEREGGGARARRGVQQPWSALGRPLEAARQQLALWCLPARLSRCARFGCAGQKAVRNLIFS